MKKITLYSQNEIEGVYKSGQILAKVLEELKERAIAGVSLVELDRVARERTLELGGKPAFLGYKPNGASRPYQASICASVNDVIVHGVPNKYSLKDGDVLKIDFGVVMGGFFSDSAVTVGIGKISSDAARLVKATEEALRRAVAESYPGKTLGDLGWVIAETAKEYKCAVAQGLTGHGIGHNLHEDPAVLNFGSPGSGDELRPGMILAIEPMFTLGDGKIIQRNDDGWATRDGSLAAHFEHTVAITKGIPLVLTRTF